MVVATTSKWASTKNVPAFDTLLIDEAWQMPWADFMLLAPVAERFVLVGDPGQIEPTVTIPVPRWETSPRAPHRAAPAVILSDDSIPRVVRELPVSTRLPYDTAALVRGFYDFPFEAWADEGARRVTLDPRGARRSPVDDAIESLRDGSISLLTLPTPDDGVAPEDDRALADAAAQVVHAAPGAQGGRGHGGRAARARAGGHRHGGDAPRDERTARRGARRPRGPRARRHPRALAGPGAQGDGGGAPVVGGDAPLGLQPRDGAAVRDGLAAPGGAGDRLARPRRRDARGLRPVADQAPAQEDACGRGHAQNLAAWRWLAANGRIARYEG